METLLYLIAQAERAITTLKGYVQGTIATENEKEPYIAILGEINEERKEELTVSIIFTVKELKQMSRDFKKQYEENGLILRVRKVGNSYEIRYRRGNANLSASSVQLEKAKEKMRNLILAFEKEQSREKTANRTPKSPLAVDYALEWMTTIKKPILTPQSYRNGYEKYFSTHIAPFFGSRMLKEIAYSDLQAFLNAFIEREQFRTAKGIRLFFRELFSTAHADGIVSSNPAERLKPIVYDQEHGTALSLDREREIAEKIVGSDLTSKNALLVMLFAGLRPCELSTVEVRGDFFEVVSGKQRKGDKKKTRLCPITPMARKFIDFTAPIRYTDVRTLEKQIKQIASDVKPYDFRHTFITRAQECGVPQEVVQVWVGHRPGKGVTGKVYTHYSEEYMLKQAEKIDY